MSHTAAHLNAESFWRWQCSESVLDLKIPDPPTSPSLTSLHGFCGRKAPCLFLLLLLRACFHLNQALLLAPVSCCLHPSTSVGCQCQKPGGLRIPSVAPEYRKKSPATPICVVIGWKLTVESIMYPIFVQTPSVIVLTYVPCIFKLFSNDRVVRKLHFCFKL